MKLMVCGVPFEIIERKQRRPNDTNYGEMAGKEGKIYIDATMPKAIKDSTPVHEWMHAVYEQYGVQHDEYHVAIMAAELYRNGFRVKVLP